MIKNYFATKSYILKIKTRVNSVNLISGNKWEATKRKAVKAFLKKVLPSLLQLGCDPDSYVQQLFHPLVMQISHYYSSKMMLTSLQTVFIEVVFVSICCLCIF